jgi:hypothetical protein
MSLIIAIWTKVSCDSGEALDIPSETSVEHHHILAGRKRFQQLHLVLKAVYDAVDCSHPTASQWAKVR